MCLGLELIYRNGMGTMIAAVIGFLSLVVAHNLAGSGESYGFAPLSRFGKALEDAARAHDLATIESQVNAIHDYIDRVCLVRPE